MNSIFLRDISSVSIKTKTSKSLVNDEEYDRVAISFDIKTSEGEDLWVLLENSKQDIKVIVDPQIIPTVEWEIDKNGNQ